MKPDPSPKRLYVLPVAMTCKNGHTSDQAVVLPSGPHEKACCATCGTYLKFLKKGEGAPLRSKGEDRQGPRAAFVLVSATVRRGIGTMTEPVLATMDQVLASKAYRHLLEKGRIAHFDHIEGLQAQRRVRC